MQCRARIGDAANAHALSLIFKQALSHDPVVGEVDLDLDLRESDRESESDASREAPSWPLVGPYQFVVSASETSLTLASEVVFAILDRSVAPVAFTIRTRRHSLSDDAFRVHLSVALHRALLS